MKKAIIIVFVLLVISGCSSVTEINPENEKYIQIVQKYFSENFNGEILTPSNKFKVFDGEIIVLENSFYAVKFDGGIKHPYFISGVANLKEGNYLKIVMFDFINKGSLRKDYSMFVDIENIIVVGYEVLP